MCSENEPISRLQSTPKYAGADCGFKLFILYYGVLHYSYASFQYLRIGKLPRGIAIGQPVALLDQDLEALGVFVVAHREDDVSSHLCAVKVS